jgi:hypothetical protein
MGANAISCRPPDATLAGYGQGRFDHDMIKTGVRHLGPNGDKSARFTMSGIAIRR